MVLTAWQGLCRNKEEGGLSFKLLRPFHEALIGKQLTKFYDKPLSLWAQVIRHKYRPSRIVWDLQIKSVVSQAWRAIAGGCDTLRKGLKWEVGNGSSIQSMNDSWVSPIPLKLWPNISSFANASDEFHYRILSPQRENGVIQRW